MANSHNIRAPVSPHTRAWLAFEENLEGISHMLSMSLREVQLVQSEAIRVQTYLNKFRDLKTKATVAKLLRSLERYAKKLHVRVERAGTAKLWQVVMLVTCVEAYLQDLLSMAARVDPQLMEQSQQTARYVDVIAATSLDELANELSARWARGWLSDGGPTRWLSRLGRMGARGYPDDLGRRLELIWGIRHTVVHAAGVASADFVKRHPGVVTGPGVRVRVGTKDFGAFVEAVGTFLEPTEQFFLARYPLLFAAAPTEPIG